jgi:hypothetical protein
MSRLYKVWCRVQRKNLVDKVPVIITEYKIDDETSTSPTLSQLNLPIGNTLKKLMPRKVYFVLETFDAHEQTL